MFKCSVTRVARPHIQPYLHAPHGTQCISSDEKLDHRITGVKTTDTSLGKQTRIACDEARNT